MSASREKKTRQDLLAGGPTEKERRSLEEAKKAKNKKVFYWVLGVVIAILVVVLLIWDSGVFQRRTAAATVGDKTYTVGDVSFYYYGIRNQVAQYANYGMITSYDSTLPDDQQTVDADSVTWLGYMGVEAQEGDVYADLFRSYALDALQYETFMCAQAASVGYTLSAEGQEQVDSSIQSFRDAAKQQNASMAALLRANYGPYLTESSFKTRVTNSTLASEFEQYKRDSYDYSDAEVDAYCQEHKDTLYTFEYRSAFISGTPTAATNDAGQTVEPTEAEKAVAMQQAKAKADAMAEQVRGGADFNTAAQQYVAETSQAQYADPEYGHYHNVGSAIRSASYGEWLTDAGRKANEVTVAEVEGSGYYVVQYLDSYLDTETRYSVDIRHILVMAEHGTQEPAEGSESTEPVAVAPTEEQYAAAKAKVEDILAQFEAGDKTPTSFGALADQYSEDPGSNGSNTENGGSSGGYYQVLQSTNFFADFKNWCLDPARKAGDTEIIQNTQTDQWGYHLMYFQQAGPLVWEHSALTTMQSEAYQSWYDEAVAASPVTPVEKGMAMVG